MFRINGIGTTFAGVSKPDHDGLCTATKWVTFVFVPIFPLARFKVKPISHRPFLFSFKILEKTPLVLQEVLRTYLFGWLLFPLMIFVPFFTAAFLATPEMQREFNLPEWSQILLLCFSLLWLIVTIWKLKSWDHRRWFKKA